MSINTANTAISGLKAQNQALSITSDNIANAGTPFYKTRDTFFSTFVTRSTTPGGVRSTVRQAIDQQGVPLSTTSVFDLSIAGKGFYVLKDSDKNDFVFSRGGSFEKDNDGHLRTKSGHYLMGWKTDHTGKARTGNIHDLNQMDRINIRAVQGISRPTSVINMRANYPASASNGEHCEVPITIFDSLGLPHTMKIILTKKLPTAAPTAAPTALITGADDDNDDNTTSTPLVTAPALTTASTDGDDTAPQYGENAWVLTLDSPDDARINLRRAGADSKDSYKASGNAGQEIIVRFSTTGALEGFYQLNNAGSALEKIGEGGALPAVRINFGTHVAESTVQIDLGAVDDTSATSQTGGSHSTLKITQDGIPVGTFSNISIREDGAIQALFDNGETRVLYKLPLVDFSNPNGLQALSWNVYIPTNASGEYQIYHPGQGVGNVTHSSLESSTVDIAEDFTRILQTQQFFLANTKVIQVNSDMERSLIDIIR